MPSDFRHQTSYIRHHTSAIFHQPSSISHQTSYIFPLPSYIFPLPSYIYQPEHPQIFMSCIGSVERANDTFSRLIEDCVTTNLMGSYSPRRIRISISYTVPASFFFWFVCSSIFLYHCVRKSIRRIK